jgi:NAD(P)-dependent dehydrogenase (short-subunit alcohol dehydrogenase family)
MIDFGLRDRVIAITGGGSGIGRQTALLAAAGGARLAICDADPVAAETVRDEIRASGAEAIAIELDVRDAARTRSGVIAIERDLGPIDGLVAAAGISRPGRAEDLDEAVWANVIGVNLTGVFLTCQTVGRGMIERGAGSIVAIASGDALGGHAGRAPYCASKFGVVGLVQTLAIEWGRHGVRVNATAPGGVDTPMLRGGVPQAFIEGVMIDRTPAGRLSTALDQACACLFLLSEASQFINGVLLPVDGGATAGYLTHRNGEDYASNAMLAAKLYAAG